MNSLLVAMRVARWLPRSVVRGGAWLGVSYAWVSNGKSRHRLEENLARVTGLEGKELSRLSRRGLLSIGRYYAEVFEMSRITTEQASARARIVGEEAALATIHGNAGAVVVLGHSGNWDLAGAKAVVDIAPVSAVAEVLKPPEVFDEFVRLRARLGIRIYGHEGSNTFCELLREARAPEARILALVADRDMTGSGVEVTMWGRRVKVAPGPAALAKSGGLPLIPILVYYERLHGARRRAARSRWGIVMDFAPALDPTEYVGEGAVERLTQVWAAWLAEGIAAHPQDWHMLQRFGWVE